MLEINKIYNGDCLELMPHITDKSVDMILCDLPYGVLNKGNSSAKWDSIIPFSGLWNSYKRIIKSNGVIVLTGQGLFTADLMLSNRKMWRYNLIWDKVAKTGFLNSKKMQLRQHEDICVFYTIQPTYNPQMQPCEPHKRNHSKGNLIKPSKNSCYGSFVETPTIISDEKFPTSIISISKEHTTGHFLHPTQKPVLLFEYLIRTYTNEGEIVLDNCAGSGTTAIACMNTKRNFICMEKDDSYFKIAQNRINKHHVQQILFQTR